MSPQSRVDPHFSLSQDIYHGTTHQTRDGFLGHFDLSLLVGRLTALGYDLDVCRP